MVRILGGLGSSREDFRLRVDLELGGLHSTTGYQDAGHLISFHHLPKLTYLI